MPVAAQGDVRRRPTCADAPNQPAQMGPHLDATRRLAGPQDDGHRSAAIRIVDVNRQEAALVIMRIEQRELLAAVDDVASIVDIESNRRRFPRVTIHPCIDQGIGQTDHVAQPRSILQARQGRLGTQIAAGIR
jgi:hypothetical protein